MNGPNKACAVITRLCLNLHALQVHPPPHSATQPSTRRSACLALRWDQTSWSNTNTDRRTLMPRKTPAFVPSWPAHGPSPAKGTKTEQKPVMSLSSTGQHISTFFWLFWKGRERQQKAFMHVYAYLGYRTNTVVVALITLHIKFYTQRKKKKNLYQSISKKKYSQQARCSQGLLFKHCYNWIID